MLEGDYGTRSHTAEPYSCLQVWVLAYWRFFWSFLESRRWLLALFYFTRVSTSLLGVLGIFLELAWVSLNYCVDSLLSASLWQFLRVLWSYLNGTQILESLLRIRKNFTRSQLVPLNVFILAGYGDINDNFFWHIHKTNLSAQNSTLTPHQFELVTSIYEQVLNG